MDMIRFSEIASSEEAAEEYLRSKGILPTHVSCPRCGGGELSQVRGRSLLCRGCRHEWSRREGSILARTKVSSRQLVSMLLLFGMEQPALPCSRMVRLHRNTVNRFYRLFRESLASAPQQMLGGEVEADESYFGGRRKGRRGRGAAGKLPVFGIIERNGRVAVKVVPNVTKKTLQGQLVKTVKRGSLIYTDKYKSYDGLVSYGFRHERINHSKRFANGKVYINGIEGFWSFAKQRLQKFHGTSKQNFHLYLKEMEARYNSLDDDFFEILVSRVAEKHRCGTV